MEVQVNDKGTTRTIKGKAANKIIAKEKFTGVWILYAEKGLANFVNFNSDAKVPQIKEEAKQILSQNPFLPELGDVDILPNPESNLSLEQIEKNNNGNPPFLVGWPKDSEKSPVTERLRELVSADLIKEVEMKRITEEFEAKLSKELSKLQLKMESEFNDKLLQQRREMKDESDNKRGQEREEMQKEFDEKLQKERLQQRQEMEDVYKKLDLMQTELDSVTGDMKILRRREVIANFRNKLSLKLRGVPKWWDIPHDNVPDMEEICNLAKEEDGLDEELVNFVFSGGNLILRQGNEVVHESHTEQELFDAVHETTHTYKGSLRDKLIKIFEWTFAKIP
ncbi:hypothetical protein HK098_006898 [Nowakowskiella sp. JEL0407]|nr:hypothetical protein HK098_006898 [Nowakowskiella sp. JEL0407]